MIKKALMVAGPVHTNPPLKGAAVETWMYEVSKRLYSYEPHIVSISHPFYPAREFRDGIFFHRIHIGRIYKRLFQKLTKFDPMPYTRRLAMIINKVQPHVVHMHNSMNLFVPIVPRIRKEGIKTILHMHNEMPVTADVKVDRFIGCSNYIVNAYRDFPLLQAEDYSRIYNGVDLERFRPHWENNSLKEDVRNRFGVNKDEFVVIHVGRISPEKGTEHFINSALMLEGKRSIRFFVIGEVSKGPASNERVTYAQKVIKMASPLGDRIIFTDYVPHTKVHLLYLLGDVIVIPSNFNEPFSMSAIEAMATGLPVIARKKGGLKEYIRDGWNGLFIEEGNIPEDITNKINTVISNNDLRRKLSVEARKTVENNFSWDIIAAEVEKHYHKLHE